MAINETAGYSRGYDAASDSSTRSMLFFPRNSRLEITAQTRSRLAEKSRALEANFPFITRIKSKFGRAVAGRGIFPNPVTDDLEWNELAKTFFERWAGNPLIYSTDASCDFWSHQARSAEELGAGDGEVFSAFANRGGMLMMQPLDIFEIESPESRNHKPGTPDAWQDGVKTDEFGRPFAYSVRELPAANAHYNAPGNWRTVPAENMLHLFRRRRVKQLRGLPPMYSGINTGNDVMDKLALELATEKLHSLLAVAKTTKANNKGKGLSNQIETLLNADGTINRLEEQMPRGAAAIELDEGEALQLLNSSRPSMNFLEGAKFDCRLIAFGVDLPLSVVYGYAELGGTPTRAELEDAQNTFEMAQDRLVWGHSQRIYVRRLALAQERGEIRKCRDPYWWKSDWVGPAKITVDYGRSADANISLVRAGLMSTPTYFEERGKDARDEMRKQVSHIKWLIDLCKAEGVPIENVIEPTPGAVTNVKLNQPSAE